MTVLTLTAAQLEQRFSMPAGSVAREVAKADERTVRGPNRAMRRAAAKKVSRRG